MNKFCAEASRSKESSESFTYWVENRPIYVAIVWMPNIITAPSTVFTMQSLFK